MYDFDVILDRKKLSTSKWEGQISEKKNPNLLCFGTADMDFCSAPPIINALREVVEAGHFGYPFKRVSYYEAIIDWYERKFGWSLQKRSIASNVGIYPSMQAIIEMLTREGDEIIIQTPVHFVFQEVISSAGRVVVMNPLRKEADSYTMDFDHLKKCISSKTKFLWLCNPHNPVGRVWTRQELTTLSEICLEAGISIVSDEVYCGLVYHGQIFTPVASLSKDVSMHAITCMSASKTYNITGMKHSLVITESEDLMDRYYQALKRSNLSYGGSIFGQAALEAAFRYCDDWVEELMTYIEGNFKLVKEFFAVHLPEVKVTTPQSTYFSWLDFSYLGLSNEALKTFFEETAQIIVASGYVLGKGGEGHVRLNMGCPRSILEAGLLRIKDASEKIK